MNIQQLYQRLATAKSNLEQSFRTFNTSVADFQAVSAAERDLAAAKGEQYATDLNMGVRPEAAISGAFLLQDEYLCFLTFNAMEQLPGSELFTDAGTAVVELIGCLVTRFGHPNDEALPGHPLYHSGLGGYGIYEVHNSNWCKAVVAVNRVSFPETDESYRGRHFLFVFHDSSFECLASSIVLEVKKYSPRFQKVLGLTSTWFSMEAELRGY